MKHKIISAAAILVCCAQAAFGQTQLVTNGGFELGQQPWFFIGAGSSIGGVIGSAHSGSYYLTMGNVNAADQQVYQTFNIPTNAALATLSYYWAVSSRDSVAIDRLQAWVMVNGSSVSLIDVQFNTSPNGAYFQKTFNLTPFLTPYTGQTLGILFRANNDLNNGMLTSFFIDDVSVQTATAAELPPNDDFANRLTLTGTNFTALATNTFATKEIGEPNHGNNTGGRSLWWTWTAPMGGVVTLDTVGSTFNTLLGVYTGSSVSNLTLIEGNNGVNQSSGLAKVKFNVSPGSVCQIAVDGLVGNIGKISLNLNLTPDVTLPKVSFTSPSANSEVNDSTVLVKGKASDNIGVDRIEYRLENSLGTNAYQIATGTNIWSATVTNLIPGPNTVRIRAIDLTGNASAAVARSFIYVVLSPFTLSIVGNGTVTPNQNGQMLKVGGSYTITAKPGTGAVFESWTGGIVSTLAKLTFLMQSNLMLQANFIPNPFLPVTGTYQGLFYDTNGTAQPSSGFITVTIKSTGASSAKVVLGGKSYSLSGQFTTTGYFSNSIVRKGLSPVSVQLQLDMVGTTMTGQLSDGVWVAQLLANRAVYSKTAPAPLAGKYTMLIPGADTSDSRPGGDGFSALSVDSAGGATFSGLLADGSKVSQKTFVSAQGQLPFYLTLYKGNGVALGWLTITNLGTNDIDGLVSWIKLPQAGAFYPGGFTNETAVLGSVYAFTSGVPVLNVSTGLLWMANGNLPQSISNQIVLSTANKVTGTTNAVSLSITTTSGAFKGSVPNPAGGKAIPVNGVVLQKQNFGGGAFSGTNQIGRAQFGP